MNNTLNAYNFYKDHIQNDKHYKNLYNNLCTISERNGHLHPQTTIRNLFYEKFSKDFQENPTEYEVVRNGQKRIAQLMYEFLLKQARDLSEELKAKNISKGVFVTGIQFIDMCNSIYSVDYHGIPLAFKEYSTMGSLTDPPDYEITMVFPPSDHLLSQLEDEIIESFPNENIYDLPRSEEYINEMARREEERKSMSEEALHEYDMNSPYGDSFMPPDLEQTQDAFLKASHYIREQEERRMEMEM